MKYTKNGVDLVISRAHILFMVAILSVGVAPRLTPGAAAQNSSFHNAPPPAAAMNNPYKSASAAAAGKKLYALNCAQCHGSNLQGIGPAPALDRAPVKNAKPGELFWFITKGKLESGMPSWSNLPAQQRWQIVTFLESQGNVKAEAK
jgi:mono/diheme cytochrome c family protein